MLFTKATFGGGGKNIYLRGRRKDLSSSVGGEEKKVEFLSRHLFQDNKIKKGRT